MIFKHKLLLKILFFFFTIYAGQPNTLKAAEKVIEGLFYHDGQPISIEMQNGKIERINRLDQLEKPDQTKRYIAPGFIDIQVNGYVSVGFSSDDLSIEGVRKVTQTLWKVGVTSYLPTVITSSNDQLRESFKILADAIREPDIGQCIPGFHLEGPYISPEDGYRGAHSKRWIRPPDWSEFSELNRIADNKIILVTVAPDQPGAGDFIQKCAQQGIFVALGHHNSSAAQIKSAADNGAALSTHLGNGCANMINRHENVLWPQLAEDRLMISIIADGFHLRPEEVAVFFKAKRAQRVILVSDMTKFAGMHAGRYTWLDIDIEVTPTGKIVNVGQNNLAGASFPITRGIYNVMQFTGCPLSEAIDMATANPAKLLGLPNRGEIKAGKRADLVIFGVESEELVVYKTYVGGELVYER